MGTVKNCPNCGKIYMDYGRNKMCPECVREEQEQERVVLDFVRDNRQVNIKDIVDGTGVKEKIIVRMIRDGRFIEHDIPIAYPCETCGTPITRGRLCKNCGGKIMKQVDSISKAKADKKDRSHSMSMMKK